MAVGENTFLVVAIDNQNQVVAVLGTHLCIGLGADMARRAFNKNPDYYDVLVINNNFKSDNDLSIIQQFVKFSAYYNIYYSGIGSVYPILNRSDDLNSNDSEWDWESDSDSVSKPNSGSGSNSPTPSAINAFINKCFKCFC